MSGVSEAAKRTLGKKPGSSNAEPPHKKQAGADDEEVQQVQIEEEKEEGNEMEILMSRCADKCAERVESKMDAMWGKFEVKMDEKLDNMEKRIEARFLKKFQEQEAKYKEEFQKDSVTKAGSSSDGAAFKAADDKVNNLTNIVEEMTNRVNKMEIAGVQQGASSNDTRAPSKTDPKIGNKSKYRERDPATLVFTGRDPIEKIQVAAVVEEELKKLNIEKGKYKFSGKGCGTRFMITFTEGAAGLNKPSDVARYVKTSYDPKTEGESWKKVSVMRDPDGIPVEFEFGYDQDSNQTIKEIITKTIYKQVKEFKDDKGKQAFKMYKRDGAVFRGFECVAQVNVGVKENSFQVTWINKNAFTDKGIDPDEVDKQLRVEYTRWCL